MYAYYQSERRTTNQPVISATFPLRFPKEAAILRLIGYHKKLDRTSDCFRNPLFFFSPFSYSPLPGDYPKFLDRLKSNYSGSQVYGGGDSSVVRAPDSWLKGRGFESLLERRENFFSRVDFLCWLLFLCPFHPRVTTVARKKSRSFCQKVQVAGYS